MCFVSPDTLAKLLNGDFADRFDDFRILDCRFPYEYSGGHIAGRCRTAIPPRHCSRAGLSDFGS